MKLSRNGLLAILCMAVSLGLTSCFGDDDDDKETIHQLTKEERAAQVREMAGNYQGWIYYGDDQTLKTDSAAIFWTVTAPDSTLALNSLPVGIFKQGINDKAIREIFDTPDVVSVRAELQPYVNTSKTPGFYTYWALPKNDVVEFDIFKEDATHHVKVNFAYQMDAYVNTYSTSTFYSVGEYLEGKMLAYLLIKSVVVDGREFTTGRADYFFGSKTSYFREQEQ